jgi:hypothetical protein
VPVLDQDAPILYGLNNQNQNAAVYTAPAQQTTAETHFRSAYLDESNHTRPIALDISSDGSTESFNIYIYKNSPELLIGVSNIVDSLNADQLSAIVAAGKKQGIAVERMKLDEFAGPEAARQLFFGGDPTATGEFLFFQGGEKGTFPYPTASAVSPRRQAAVAVILDRARRAIAAEQISIVLPQSSR